MIAGKGHKKPPHSTQNLNTGIMGPLHTKLNKEIEYVASGRLRTDSKTLPELIYAVPGDEPLGEEEQTFGLPTVIIYITILGIFLFFLTKTTTSS